MKNIYKNMIPYWKTVLVIFVLLMVQAYCDLSLPQYTSDMIDTGIQNQGTAHILPEIPRQPAHWSRQRHIFPPANISHFPSVLLTKKARAPSISI